MAGVASEPTPSAIPYEHSAERLEKEILEEEIQRTPAEPEPLRRKAPPSQPYPIHALGPLLGGAAQGLHKVIKAPLALCGQSVLAAASLAAQQHADVTIDGRTYPISLWLITIAESGERKSAVDSIALAGHKRYEREQLEIADRAEPDYQAKLAAYDAAMKQAKNRKTMTDIRSAIEAVGQAPEPPKKGILLVAEPTIEAIQKIYLSGVPSLGLFSDEGAVFFGGHSMSKDHALRSIGALSKLWDDGTSDRIRASDGQRKIYGRRLSMHMLVQPVIAETILSDPLLSGQGFLARCLIAWPETAAGTRSYVESSPWGEPGIQWFAEIMVKLLRKEPKLRERGELEPRTLTLSGPAKQTWIIAYEEIEKNTAPNGPFAQVRPWASKAAEQILRIAGVLAVIGEAEQIDPTHIKAGAELIAWHMSEVLRLVGTAKVAPEVRAAEAVLEWCHAKETWLVDSKTLLNRGPSCVRGKDTLEPAMALLVSTGHATVERDVQVGDRKARRAWRITSNCKESQKVAKSRNYGVEA